MMLCGFVLFELSLLLKSLAGSKTNFGSAVARRGKNCL